MKSIKILPVLIVLAFVVFILTIENRFAIGQSMYPLPPPSSQVLISAYPEKVKESLKNVIGITVEVYFKENVLQNMSLGQRSIKTVGTGFMLKPRIFITARHVLKSSIDSFARIGYQPIYNQHSVPSSPDFDYSIIGSTDINDKTKDFDLNLLGMGATDKFQDYMVLQSSNYPSNLKPIESDIHPLNIDEIVYNAGYVHAFLLMGNSLVDGPVLFDIIRKSFTGRVDSLITNLPINKKGVSVLYRIEIKMEQGFSGGPILNSQGKVTAMTVMRNDNYLYAIPIQDINLFVEKLKKDGVVK